MMGPRVRAGGVLLFIFALGVLAGVAYERHFVARPLLTMSAADEHEAAITELRELLDLDEEQVAQIHRILAERQQLVQRKWEELRPEVQNAMRQVHTDIGELLHPDQRGRFHEWLIQRRKQHLQHQMIPSER